MKATIKLQEIKKLSLGTELACLEFDKLVNHALQNFW